ncbi:hypothetical protein CS063_14765 [Sporanaerobium hydrogeniformans]|uniref:Uncharacterized protein n=1 Tax=Sporanaerobium hydrogeniformans TaxID=3072179 RepID=A0AC61DAN0_9FIRM|nr:sensor histidine kinase [Sporanaerobium hydrogeniformans]PHV69622.1 hypothetical protein CS063_14765 [Sporanaerobium hydrogeniformans]
MKKEVRFLTFRAKLALCFICGTLFALGLQTFLFYLSSSQVIYTQAEEYSYNTLTNMQGDIYNFIRNIENNILKIYDRKEFMEDLGTGENLMLMKSKYANLAYNIALDSFASQQNINAIYIYDSNHQLISFYRHAMTPKYSYPEDIYVDKEYTNADIVLEYTNGTNKNLLISSYYNENRQANMIRFAVKIYADKGQRKIGYIVCDADQKSLLKIIKKYNDSQEQIIWLQPIGDRPVVQTGRLEGQDAVYYKQVTEKVEHNDLAESDDLKKNRSVFFEIPQQRYNLRAFSLTPQSLLEQNYKALTETLCITAIAIVFIFGIVSTLISKNLTTSLTNMVNTMSQIRKGNTSLRVSHLKSDEFGKLGESFNEMLDRIEQLIRDEYEAKLLLNDAQYKALQAQVNPHFLYNTLNTMSSIAAVQNCQQVSELSSALSHIFRYSLGMKEPTASIREELLHLENYMYIINVRTQNSIEIIMDVDNSLLDERIPRLSIQPLVENSVSHGLKNKRGDKKIWIEVKRLEKDMSIAVRDNGIGMQADTINKQLNTAKLASLERDASIGIANIDARIKLLFGDDYGITIESKEGEGCTAFLYIPSIYEEECKNENSI